MNFRSMGLLAAALLLAACSESPSNSANTSGAAQTSSAAAPSASQQMGPAKGSREDFLNTVGNDGDRVFFDFDKSNIKPEEQKKLATQATWLKTYPSVTVTVEGHCDDRGTVEYNLALGNRRAVAVKNALVALGIDAGRIKTISYGKSRPAVTGDNEAAWAQNRRGVTVIN